MNLSSGTDSSRPMQPAWHTLLVRERLLRIGLYRTQCCVEGGGRISLCLYLLYVEGLCETHHLEEANQQREAHVSELGEYRLLVRELLKVRRRVRVRPITE
jgi:hypothetical protein